MKRETGTPRHAITATRDDVGHLHQELEYTKSVLSKYKQWAERKLEDEAARYRQLQDAARLEYQNVERERDQAVKAMQRLTSDLESAAERFRVVQKTHREELAEVVQRHSEAVAASEQRRTDEVAAMQRKVTDSQALEQRAFTLEQVVSKRDDEIRRLRKALADATARQAIAEDIKATSLGLLAELQGAIEECVAFGRATTGGETRSASVERRDDPHESDPLVRCSLTAEDLRETLAAVHGAAALRLKETLDANASLEQQLAQQTADIQRERDLIRRRMDEVERDRATERSELQRRIETSRVDSIVASQIDARHRTLYEQSASGRAAASPARRRTVAVAVQTAMDASTLGATAQPAESTQRLVAEINRLQDDSHQLRQALVLLEEQRAAFLGFVNDDAIGAYIANVLAGPSSDLFRHS